MSWRLYEKCLDHGNCFDCPLLGHFNVGRQIVMLSHTSEIMPSVRRGQALYFAMTRIWPRISPPGETVVWTFA
jgi:hypothetical protein